MSFSTAVKIAQLDDFINPSQDCIIPIMNKDSKIDTNDPTYMYSQAQESNLILTNQKKKTAEISLSDCLACSGCVTTAESILKQEQSVSEFRDRIEQNTKEGGINIVTLSTQSLASLAYHFKVDIEHMSFALNKFFQTHFPGVQFYDNMNFPVFLALYSSAQEFIKKYQNKEALPLIASECPGWTCYAEKQAAEAVIQHMSKIKSPQQILGSTVKQLYKDLLGFQNKIWVGVVMPCYDKKVESSRKEFESGENMKDIDTVLTTTELMDLIKELELPQKKEKQSECCENNNEEEKEQQSKCCNDSKNTQDQEKCQENNTNIKDIFPYNKAEQTEKDQVYKNSTKLEEKLDINLSHMFEYCKNIDFTSNGYSEFILHFVAKNVLKIEDYEIVKKQMKNSDFIEVHLMGKVENQEEKSKILSFAKVYGLKNIQNLLRNLKMKKCKYQYIEVMACPSGCVNGGGQMKQMDETMKSKEFNAKISEVLNIQFQSNYVNSEKQGKQQQQISIEEVVQKLLNSNGQIFDVNYKHIDKTISQTAYQW